MAPVTVVIPSFNHEQTIERCLRSVIGQTFEDWRCLVIDDCSSDDTVELAQRIAERDPRVEVLVNSENRGLVGNHNECLRRSDTPFIKFVHADDWLLPDCLQRMLHAFDDSEVVLAFAPRTVTGSNDAWAARYAELPQSAEFPEGPERGDAFLRRYCEAGAYGNWIGEPTAVMLRRSAVSAVGGFNPWLAQALDIEFWNRVAATGSIVRIPVELSVREHGDSTATERNQRSGAGWLDDVWVMLSLGWATRLRPGQRLRLSVRALKVLGRAVVTDLHWTRDPSRRRELGSLLLPRRKARFLRAARL